MDIITLPEFQSKNRSRPRALFPREKGCTPEIVEVRLKIHLQKAQYYLEDLKDKIIW